MGHSRWSLRIKQCEGRQLASQGTEHDNNKQEERLGRVQQDRCLFMQMVRGRGIRDVKRAELQTRNPSITLLTDMLNSLA